MAKNWKPKIRSDVSRHDHVGFMIWLPTDAACRECGQAWELTEFGWKPV